MAGFGEAVALGLFRTLGASRALTPVHYRSLSEAVIDLETGQVTQSSPTTTYQMRVADFARREIDGVSVIAGDRLARLPVRTFQGIPTIRDHMTIENESWEVIGITKSANEGLWVWHVRRIGAP
jgi:hypothetical protein